LRRAGFEPATSLLKGEVSVTYATAKTERAGTSAKGLSPGLSPSSLLSEEVTLNYAMPECVVGGNKQIRWFLMNEVTEPFTTPTGFDCKRNELRASIVNFRNRAETIGYRNRARTYRSCTYPCTHMFEISRLYRFAVHAGFVRYQQLARG
jgi:hypothetical protein